MTPESLINVLDLEATCWDGPPPPGQASEVIEIGLCVFGAKYTVLAPIFLVYS